MNKSKEPEAEIDISAGQKMLSAVSGITPLDVVRVRLQSQPSSSFIPSRLSPASAFANLPPNLGVTACCREVFWVNNTSSVCMAAESPSAAVNTAIISSPASAADCAIDETRRKTFTSTLDGLRKIARNEGISSLWRGLSPTLVMSIPANVIYFTGYDSLRYNPNSPINIYIPDAYAPLVAGSMARTTAASVISPIEMFRTRMQATTTGNAGKGVFTETLIGLRNMVHAQGYTSLWRGLTLTMWRDVPFSGIYWWGYETMRNVLTDIRDPLGQRTRPRSNSRNRENHTTTFMDSFVAGATSGAVASLMTTPFDVGKTRRQVLQPVSADKAGKKTAGTLRPEELSMPRFLYRIWADEGIQGLFRGWAARCLRVAPACAIMISSYEIGKKMARSLNEKTQAEIQR
ncbi:hypothetical protein MMC22_002102 [Lobaria immixta]|nr:hypothetical protein [Lobaria immixta]